MKLTKEEERDWLIEQAKERLRFAADCCALNNIIREADIARDDLARALKLSEGEG